MKIFFVDHGTKEEDIIKPVQEGCFVSFSIDSFVDGGGSIEKIVAAIPQKKILINDKKEILTDERGAIHPFQEVAKKISAARKNANTEDILRIAAYNAAKAFGMENDMPDKYVYKIRNTLYINVTNRCSNNCDFCPRLTEPVVKGHYLKIKNEPSADTIIGEINKYGDLKKFDEVVFCGYGEPTTRIDIVKDVAKWLKENGCKTRINTNGHANLIAGRNILPELDGLLDTISISLNYHSSELYNEHCRPVFKDAWQGILDFAEKAKTVSPRVIVSVVSGVNDVDVEACRKIAERIGVEFRSRTYYR